MSEHSEYRFADIRSWNGSQNEGFEELCCQLASYEYRALGAEFRRIRGAGGDAGVEAYWLFSDGSKHGWQAKYFFKLGSNEWTQIDDSVHTALAKHPDLASYTICLPIDRNEGKKEREGKSGTVIRQRSVMDHWDEHVTKWQQWAAAKGSSVRFNYWGKSEIFEHLSRTEHSGRRYFWFNQVELTSEWFGDRLAEALATAGPRYTSETNVQLPISRSLAAVARMDSFYDGIDSLRTALDAAMRQLRMSPSADAEVVAAFETLRPQYDSAFSIFVGENRDSFLHLGFDGLAQRAEAFYTEAETLQGAIRDAITKYKSGANGERSAGSYDPRLTSLQGMQSSLYSVMAATNRVVEFCRSTDARASNIGSLLITGHAGQGKTHLVCDTGVERLKDGLSTVVLFGEQFSDEEPWSQVIKFLHLSCKTPDEFVGALNAYAEARGRRSLIAIDALNETDNRNYWRSRLPGMLQFLTKYPGVVLVVTCRTSYEPLVIPDHVVPNRLVPVEHQGFAGHEAKAASVYFRYYGIEEPNVPLMQPEFANPLFLKLFCKSLQSEGHTRIPGGYRGVTSIFRFFTASAHKQLSAKMDYDPKVNYVDLALSAMADRMADDGTSWVLREEAKGLVNALLPGRTGHNESLYANLVHEGLLVENIHWNGKDRVEGVRMGFERFTDHLIAHSLLARHLDRSNPSESFRKGLVLGDLFLDEHQVWFRRGWVEALSVQIPEQLGCELVDLIPHAGGWEVLQQSFLQSLIWRDPNKVGQTTDAYLNTVYSQRHEETYAILLMLAADPDQTYNARSLHKHLMKLSMPKRDSLWSIFLHNRYGNGDAVDRLLEWAWHANKSAICDESIELSGIALTWYFTTSHRFVRDRATKALVSLLRTRPRVMSKLLSLFQDVDDLYVAERLYAAAYGVALTCSDDDAVGELAQIVYQRVFSDGKPTAHILLRDYARGVVESAVHRGTLPSDVDIARVRPPYASDWPLTAPDESEISMLGELHDDPDEGEVAAYTIYGSIMGHVLGDFSHYVIGESTNWSSHALDEDVGISRTTADSFFASLTKRQARAWENLQIIEASMPLILALNQDARAARFPSSDDDMTVLSESALRRFLQLLGKKKRAIYEQQVAPYLERRDDGGFDMNLLRRWIVRRVFDLGWAPELFGHFDRWLHYGFSYGRSGHKPERIGKKYQWIALHEGLAHLADHLYLKSYDEEHPAKVFDNPGEIGRRDIDPSMLLDVQAEDGDDGDVERWWYPRLYVFQNANAEEKDVWTLHSEESPSPCHLIQVTDPSTETPWLYLYGNHTWIDKYPGDSSLSRPWREMWFHVRCYLVRREHSAPVFLSLHDTNLWGKHISEVGDLYQVFLGEYPWASSCQRPGVRWDWISEIDFRGEPLPHPVAITAMSYVNISEYDCSIVERAGGLVPSNLLIESMGLCWDRGGFAYRNGSGQLVLQDPSVQFGGSQALLLDSNACHEFLDQGDYDLIWTILGAREHHLVNHSAYNGVLSVSGAYRFVNGVLTGSIREHVQSYTRAEGVTNEWQGREIHRLPYCQS